jgi:hypothetical protein
MRRHINLLRFVAILCAALLAPDGPYAYAFQTNAQDQPQSTLSPGQLDSLVAPLALYPDPILSQVLVASTYPLEIVEAERWLSQNPSLTGKALTDAAAQQPWDASVQALAAMPDLLKWLSSNIRWTTDLGNAFLAQQQDVMDAVQRMRQKAMANGTLKSTPQQTVSTTSENGQTFIQIMPAEPQVVYLPQYNPAAVWGAASASYPWPAVSYPSAGAIATAGVLSFGAGIALGALWGGGWGGWGWGPGWGSRNIVVNNNFIRSNRFNRGSFVNGNRWAHNPGFRGGVPYSNRNVANRFGRGNFVNGRPTPGQIQQGLRQGSFGQRPGTIGGPAGGNRAGPGGNVGRPGQGNIPGRGGMPGQGNFAGPGGAGHPGMGPGNMPGRGGMPGQVPGPANIPGRGQAARMGNFGQMGGGQRIGNRTFSGGGGPGAFAGVGQGGSRARMSSGRGFGSMGAGGFRGGGFRGGGGGFRGGGRRR